MLHQLELRDIASSQHDLALGMLLVSMSEAEAECLLMLSQRRSQGTQRDYASNRLLVSLAEGGQRVLETADFS